MFAIDKEKFGAFLAALRREKRLTQKDVAEKLFVSDKAVSKWETGASIPDPSLLVPLAELLGVSVTELLRCERGEPADSGAVENVVKAAISYGEEKPTRAYATAGIWKVLFVLSLILGALGLWLHTRQGGISEAISLAVILGAVFGAYFCFFAQAKLPDYYDQNRIHGMMDGPFRMNIPGLTFNNRNWPYLVLVGRIWCCAVTGLYPLLALLLARLCGPLWAEIELYVYLTVILGGLFGPMYVVGKKFE